MRSLQARLSTGLVIALVVLLGLLLLVGGYSLQHLIEVFVAERLEHDMDAVLTALNFDQDGRPLLEDARLNTVFRQPYSGHYYKLTVGDRVLRSRSLWDTDLDIAPTTSAAVSRYFDHGPQDQLLLVVARTFQIQGRDVVVAITEDFTPLAAGLRQLLLDLALLALLLLGLMLITQKWIVRQGLKPLNDIHQDILHLTRGELQRLRAETPIEMQPLVAEINRLIELMEQRLQRSRHALGNLAHALKTPLTQLLQLAEHQPQDLRTELERPTQQVKMLIDRELKRARIAGGAAPGQRVVLNREVTDIVNTLGKIYRDKALRIDFQIPSGSLFPGDRDDILELLGNLLDNACQWAAGRVRLCVTESDHCLYLSVEDDGPGCPPELLDRLTRRGARLDEDRNGHGLGLAIVADIIEQYGGLLRLGRSDDLGGFAARVELPIAG